ncbi:hypothetical protein [Rhizobium leguminosarum]|uniref:hypothetical protein n=1 Tax=Rhizobium leguminosarum TaxID=384 RepID=UPI00391F4152
MKVRQTQPRSGTTTHDPVPQRLLVISRYVENLRLPPPSLPYRVRRGQCGPPAVQDGGCMEWMSNDIAVSATGAIILRRSARLVGTVEGLVEWQAKFAVLH